MSYTRNITNSFQFGLPELILQKFTGLGNLRRSFEEGEESKAIIKDVFKESSEFSNSIIKPDDDGNGGILSDLKQGNLIRSSEQREKEEMAAMGFGDMDLDMDFDDDDFGDASDDDIDTESTTSVDSGDADAPSEVTNNIVNNDLSKKSITNSFPTNINSMGGDSGSVTSRENATAIILASRKSSSSLANIMAESNESIFNAINDQTRNDTGFYQEAGRFYAVTSGSLANLEVTLEKIQTLAGKQAERVGIKEDGSGPLISSEPKHFEDVFEQDGSFNSLNFTKIIGKRITDWISEDSPMVEMLKNVARHPFEALADSLVEKGFASKFGAGLRELDKTLGSIPHLMFRKLEEVSKSDSVFAPIADFFKLDRDKSYSQLAKYERGPIPFDGITKKSIVEVIPSLLAKIHKAIQKGNSELVYDYASGTFTTDAEINKKIIKKETSDFESGNSNFFKAARDNEDFKDLSSNQKKKISQDMTATLSEYSRKSKQLDDTFESDGTAAGNLIQKIIRSSGVGSLAEFNRDLVVSRDSLYENKANLSEAERTYFASQNMTGDTKKGKGSERIEDTAASSGSSIYGKRKSTISTTINDEDLDNSHIDKKDRFGDDAILGKKGEWSIKDIAASPLKLVARATNIINDKVGETFFGRKREKEESPLVSQAKTQMNKIFSSISRKIYGEDEFNEDGTPKNKGRKNASNLFGNVLNSFRRFSHDVQKGMGQAFDRLTGLVDTYFFRPLQKMADNTWKWFQTDVASPLKEYFFGEKGKDKSWAGAIFSSVGAAFDSAFSSASGGRSIVDMFSSVKEVVSTKLGSVFGSVKEFVIGKNTEKGRDGGLFGAVINKFNSEIFSPAKQYFFGKEEKDADGNVISKEGVFTNLGSKIASGILDPVKKAFSDTAERLTASLITPLKMSLFGKESVDADGNKVGKDGIFTKMSAKISQSIVNPAKDYFFGSEDKESLGLFRRIGDGVLGIFTGEKEGDDKRPFFDKVMSRLDVKLFAPIKDFFMNPDTGLFPTMGSKIDQHIFKPLKTWLVGENDNGEGVLNKVGDWFNSKVFDPMGKALFGDEANPGVFKKMENWFVTEISTPFKAFMFGDDGNGGFWGDLKTGIDTFLFGNDDGVKGLKQRVFDPAFAYIDSRVVQPLKNTLETMWNDAGTFFTDKVVTPLKGTFEPFVKELGVQFREFKDLALDGLTQGFQLVNQQVGDAMGISITDMMDKYVVAPVKDVLSEAKKMITGILSKIIQAPVNWVKNASENLRERHKSLGMDYAKDFNKTEKIQAEKLSVLDRLRNKMDFAVKSSQDSAFKNMFENFGLTTSLFSETSTKFSKDLTSNIDGVKESTQSFWKGLFGSEKGSEMAKEVAADANSAVEKVKSALPTSVSDLSGKVSELKSRIGLGDTEPEAAISKDEGKKADSKITSTTIEIPEVSAVSKIDNIGENFKEKNGISEPQFRTKTVEALNLIRNSNRQILRFLKSNLQGLGHDVARIVKHLKAGKLSGAENEGRKGFFEKLTDFVAAPFKFAGDIVKDAFSSVASIASEAAKTLFQFATLPIKLVKTGLDVVSSAAKAVGPLISGAASVVGSALKTVGKTVTGLAGVLGETLVGAASTAGSVVVDAAKGIGTIVGKVIPAMGQLVGAASQVVGAFGKMAGSFLSFAFNLGASAFRKATGSFGIQTTKAVRIEGGFLDFISKPMEVFVIGGSLDGSLAQEESATAALPAPDPSPIQDPAQPNTLTIKEFAQEKFNSSKQSLIEAKETLISDSKEVMAPIQELWNDSEKTRSDFLETVSLFQENSIKFFRDDLTQVFTDVSSDLRDKMTDVVDAIRNTELYQNLKKRVVSFLTNSAPAQMMKKIGSITKDKISEQTSVIKSKAEIVKEQLIERLPPGVSQALSAPSTTPVTAPINLDKPSEVSAEQPEVSGSLIPVKTPDKMDASPVLDSLTEPHQMGYESYSLFVDGLKSAASKFRGFIAQIMDPPFRELQSRLANALDSQGASIPNGEVSPFYEGQNEFVSNAKARLVSAATNVHAFAQSDSKAEIIKKAGSSVLEKAKTKFAETRENAVVKAKAGKDAATILKEQALAKSDAMKSSMQERLTRASERTSSNTGLINDSFSKFGGIFRAIMVGVTGMFTLFKGPIMTVLSVVSSGIGLIASGIGALKGLFGGGSAPAGSVPDGKDGKKGSSVTKTKGGGFTDKVKGVAAGAGGFAKAAVGGIAGMAGGYAGGVIQDYAAGMEDGVAKTAVGTAGSAIEYASYGAMVGSIIPGVGTAIGAGVGALYGAVKHNWDSITGAAAGLFLGSEAEYDENGYVTKMPEASMFGKVSDFFFGSDAVMNKDGTIAQEGSNGIFVAFGKTLLDIVTWPGRKLAEGFTKMKEIGVAVFSSLWDIITTPARLVADGFSAVLDSGKAVIATIGTVLTSPLEAFSGVIDSGVQVVKDAFSSVTSFISSLTSFDPMSWWDDDEEETPETQVVKTESSVTNTTPPVAPVPDSPVTKTSSTVVKDPAVSEAYRQFDNVATNPVGLEQSVKIDPNVTGTPKLTPRPEILTPQQTQLTEINKLVEKREQMEEISRAVQTSSPLDKDAVEKIVSSLETIASGVTSLDGKESQILVDLGEVPEDEDKDKDNGLLSEEAERAMFVTSNSFLAFQSPNVFAMSSDPNGGSGSSSSSRGKVASRIAQGD